MSVPGPVALAGVPGQPTVVTFHDILPESSGIFHCLLPFSIPYTLANASTLHTPTP